MASEKPVPAIQNIPLRTETGRQLREAFTKNVPLPDVDYAELERRVLENLPDEERRR
jgi:DNA polymerase I-like protein with 3'-5' exonuclease and polymerase domains